jgi:hypothetical protein
MGKVNGSREWAEKNIPPGMRRGSLPGSAPAVRHDTSKFRLAIVSELLYKF